MKEELLTYYKLQKIGGKSYWRNQLEEATPADNVGLDIYGVKLLELAELAYPDNKKESASQVRKHFLKTIPSDIATKIIETELVMKVTGSQAKHMSFAKIVEYAQGLYKTSNKSKRLMFANTPVKQTRTFASASNDPPTGVGNNRNYEIVRRQEHPSSWNNYNGDRRQESISQNNYNGSRRQIQSSPRNNDEGESCQALAISQNNY